MIFRSSSPSLLVHTPCLLFLFQTKAVMLFFRLLTGHHILTLWGHCATSCNGKCWWSLTAFIPQVWSEFFFKSLKIFFLKSTSADVWTRPLCYGQYRKEDWTQSPRKISVLYNKVTLHSSSVLRLIRNPAERLFRRLKAITVFLKHCLQTTNV